jgi:proteasome-associated ATPase
MRIRNLVDEIRVLREKLEKAGRKISSKEQEIEKIAAELADSNSEKVKDRETLTNLTLKIEQLRRDLNRANGERSRLVQEKEEVLQKLARTSNALEKYGEHIKKIEEKLKQLESPANLFAAFKKDLGKDEEGLSKAEIIYRGEDRIVGVYKEIDASKLKYGQKVIVDGGANVIMAVREGIFAEVGDECSFVSVLDAEKRTIFISTKMDEKRAVYAIDGLDLADLREGDRLLLDTRTGIVLYKLPKIEVESAILEEVPDVSFDDIGGHDEVIKRMIEEIQWPYQHPEMYKLMDLVPSKGILFFGPPGCGKTMLGKALANALVKGFAKEGGEVQKATFFLVNGPELLNKYVGETERQIRELFNKAKEKTREGYLVVIFFDEMDALFQTRGSGISSDTEKTIVPQLTTLLDGVEGLKNVIVAGASNRQELIDPAILRPGRLDLKVQISRPNEVAARQIIEKYLKKTLPFHPQYLADDEFVWHDCFAPRDEWEPGFEGKRMVVRLDKDPKKIVQYFIDRIIARMFFANKSESDIVEFKTTRGTEVMIDNRFIRVDYFEGDSSIFCFKEFLSGSILRNIVDRAKKRALVEYFTAKIEAENNGRKLDVPKATLRVRHFFDAVEEVFAELESLPNTVNPDEWIKMWGLGNRRVRDVQPVPRKKKSSAANVLPEDKTESDNNPFM